MESPGLAEFLIKTVLDVEFRDLAIADPQKAFEDFELSEEAREILINRDERLLVLLSNAFQDSWSMTDAPAIVETTSNPGPAPTRTLPEVRLRLSLVPHAIETAEAGIQFNYEAGLHPWPESTGKGHDSEGGTDQQAPADGQVDLLVRVVPTVFATATGESKVAYASTIQPPDAVPVSLQPGAEAKSGHDAGPAGQDSDSAPGLFESVSQSLADDVRQAAPGERYQKVMNLIRHQQRGEGDGGQG